MVPGCALLLLSVWVWASPASCTHPPASAPLDGERRAPLGAWAVALLALALLALGVACSLALMCSVCYNVYVRSAWSCVLCAQALWHMVLLCLCLPAVLLQHVSGAWLLGDVSCRLLPYLEVSSQGVSTFSLCALAIERFHSATSTQPKTASPESCASLLAKLAIIWVGSMILALPELLLWQLSRDVPKESCVMKPWVDLPDSVYALVFTYQESRLWWHCGCYLCLPLLFTLCCQLVTRRVAQPPAAPPRPRSLDSILTALALLYAACMLPEKACRAALTYAPAGTSPNTRAGLELLAHFLLFVWAAGAPLLLLCLWRPLGQACLDCCCCCCETSQPPAASPASSPPSTPSSRGTTPSSRSSAPSSTSTALSTRSSAPHTRLTPSSRSRPSIMLNDTRTNPSFLAIGTPC